MNRLFVIDGQNKSGKGTQVRLLTDKLNQEGFRATSIREPGGTRIGESIRSLLLSNLERPPQTDVLLFNAARAATVARISELMVDQTVVADRSYLSTLAFQVYGDGAKEASTRMICDFALSGNYNPDAFFLLDIDYGVYMKRQKPDDEHDYFERDEDYFNRVRAGFLKEAKAIGAFIIDASPTIDEVHEEIWSKVREAL
jgi:dTMP kinase